MLSDGITAHITAAAKEGPRFDPTLSPDQRRSAENGIWACTHHAREIDSDSSAFSVDLLKGLKRRREELAKKELTLKSTQEDRSAVLIDLPYAQTTYRLFEIILPQQYIFATTSAMRDIFALAEKPSHVLDLASEVIMQLGTHIRTLPGYWRLF